MSASFLIWLGELWLYAGAAVSLAFLTVGIDRVDEDARGAYIFRPLLVPGILLIWPLVLWRWVVLELDRDSWRHRHLPERNIHTSIWLVLGLLLPLIVVVGLAIKQTWPADIAPQRLEAPQ